MKYFDLKPVFGIIAIALFLTGCASGGQKAFSDAHESASKSSVEKTKAWADVEKTKYAAIGSAALKCESDTCRMGAMLATTAVSSKSEAPENKQQVIAPYVDPAVRITEKLIDKGADVVFAKYRLAERLADFGRGAASDDLLNAIDSRNTFANPFATTTTETSK